MTNKQASLPASNSTEVTLRDNVMQIMTHYFSTLKGEETQQLYNFVLDEVEEPLLIAVMKHTNNNQSEAARMLGLSRGNLRTKLQKYGML